MLTVTVPAVTSDLTVIATLKGELGITGSANDNDLTWLIVQASEAIGRYCRRETFARETVQQTERLTCKRAFLALDRDIAPSIVSVTEDGAALVDGTDYELDGSLLYRLRDDRRAFWTARTVVITYQAGYTLLGTLPADIERACLDLCVAWWNARGRDRDLRSERILDVIESSYFDPDKRAPLIGGMPADVAARLDPYRLPAVA